MNADAGQNYYFSVNRNEAISSLGPGRPIELSAGFMPAKFRAKLFLEAFNHFDAILDAYRDNPNKEKISNRKQVSKDD